MTEFFRLLDEQVRLHQKVRQYTRGQKLERVFVSLQAGAKAISHTGPTLRVNPPLPAAFGLPESAEQYVLADTVNPATAADVAALRRVVETNSQPYRRTRQHDFARGLVLQLDRSPLPARRHAEACERGYMSR